MLTLTYGLDFKLAKEILTPCIGANLIRLELEIVPCQEPLSVVMHLVDIVDEYKGWSSQIYFDTEYYEEMLTIV